MVTRWEDHSQRKWMVAITIIQIPNIKNSVISNAPVLFILTKFKEVQANPVIIRQLTDKKHPKIIKGEVA